MSNIDKLRYARIVLDNEIVISELSKIDAVAYTSNCSSNLLTIYTRNAIKPKEYYRFSSPEKRQAYLDRWIANEVKREQDKAARRVARSTHTLQKGDVLYTSWGYDQTNVSFFEVVELKGASSVKLVKLAKQRAGNDSVRPAVGVRMGNTFTKRVNGIYNSVKISSVETAWKLDKDSNGEFKSKYETPAGYGH